MSRGRKQSEEDSFDATDIFSDQDFDSDSFVDKMEDDRQSGRSTRAAWRRLEQMNEERQLRKLLDDYDD